MDAKKIIKKSLKYGLIMYASALVGGYLSTGCFYKMARSNAYKAIDLYVELSISGKYMDQKTLDQKIHEINDYRAKEENCNRLGTGCKKFAQSINPIHQAFKDNYIYQLLFG